MFTEAKITEIYCMADDFCKEFARQQEKYMIEDGTGKRRNKPNRMSDAGLFLWKETRHWRKSCQRRATENVLTLYRTDVN